MLCHDSTKKKDAKKSLEVGRVVLELAEYASAGHHGPIVLAFGGDKKSSKKASAGGVGVPSIKVELLFFLDACIDTEI